MYVDGVRKRGSWVISILEEGSSFSSLPMVFSSSSSSLVVVVVVAAAVLLLFQGRTSGKEEEMTSLSSSSFRRRRLNRLLVLAFDVNLRSFPKQKKKKNSCKQYE